MQQDYMDMFMILVSFIKPIANTRYSQIFDEKKLYILHKMFRVMKKILAIIFLVSRVNSSV